ncbi:MULTISPECIES: hypothetical protein [Enterobacteriaceae]|nr:MULTISPECIES: hypothetical protein [Enterobacteriaceae]MDM9661393.1 hypothetical protein [Raoultella planticola]MCA5535239.1 hypothetical protein [Klebsiella pneumoniae]MCJ4716278.1 hypothetical protein [Klebsiella pneumoniae]MCJ6115928.1 hypothetical protein [Klebsiella variicola]MCN9477545.1 hypothetical protein [Klebsiella pneumoniae]
MMKQPETESTLDEVRAIELFKSLGRECVQTRLDSLSAIAISRWEDAKPLPPDYSGTPIDFLTDEERGERHLMLIGQMLCIDERAEARVRIKQRIANRQMRRHQLCAD